MKAPDSEFAPDLDWMLLSGQVGEELLLEALLQEYYAETYRLALAILDDQRLAQSATIKIFATAVLQRYKYKEGDDVKLWFLSQALEIIKQIDSNSNYKPGAKGGQLTISENLPLEKAIPADLLDSELWHVLDNFDVDRRALAIFLYFLNWNDQKIARVFQCTAEDLNHQKRYINSVLLPYRMEQAARSPISLEEKLKQSLTQRWPDNTIPLLEPTQAIRQIKSQVRIIQLKNRLGTSYREIAITALIILLATLSIWGLNRFDPDQQESWGQDYPDNPIQVETVLGSPSQETNLPSNPLTQVAKETQASTSEVLYIVQPGDTISSIAEQFSVKPDFLRQVNRIPQGTQVESGQRVWLYLTTDEPGLSIEDYLATTEQPDYQEKYPYLGLSIIRGLEYSYPNIESLWLTGRVLDYGPEAYIGPPRIETIQAWLLPKATLYLVGDEQEKLKEVWLFKDFYQFMATPGVETPWAHPWHPGNPESQYLESLQLFSDTFAGRTEFFKQHTQAVETKVYLDDRWATVWEIYDDYENLLEKHWFYDQFALITNRQIFSVEMYPLMYPLLKKEVKIDQVVQDQPFPVDFFDPRIPWRGSFAANYQGQPISGVSQAEVIDPQSGRARLSPIPTNPDTGKIDISTASLTFQYPETYTQTHRAPVEIFVNQEYLGATIMGNPWSMICARSPNGESLAYVSQVSGTPSEATQLVTVDLHEPSNVKHPLPMEIIAENFSFSPDGKYLAMFGRRNSFLEGELLILNLVDLLTYKLDQLGSAVSLVWSPDGRQLALIARLQSNEYLEEILVYDLNSGQIIYRSPLDFEDNRSSEWPMTGWDVDFPVEMGGLSSCAANPQKGP